MSFTIVDVKEINKYFGNKKVTRELTEESAKTSICDYTESVLNKVGKDKDKAQKSFDKVLTKVGDVYKFRMFYGVQAVIGADIKGVKDEKDAVTQALDICEKVRRGQAGDKVIKDIRKAFEDKKESKSKRKSKNSK